MNIANIHTTYWLELSVIQGDNDKFTAYKVGKNLKNSVLILAELYLNVNI